MNDDTILAVELLTIGYEGLDLTTFLARLQAGNVQTLIDVRARPISRKKGFSKNALAEAVCALDIRYVPLPTFGCPQEIRDDYRIDGDWARYSVRYEAYLDTQELALADLANRARQSRCCLLCFEADPNLCHRSLVAARVHALAPFRIAVRHLPAIAPVLVAEEISKHCYSIGRCAR